jgi:predicted HTH domain antitoxin
MKMELIKRSIKRYEVYETHGLELALKAIKEGTISCGKYAKLLKVKDDVKGDKDGNRRK